MKPESIFQSYYSFRKEPLHFKARSQKTKNATKNGPQNYSHNHSNQYSFSKTHHNSSF